MDNFPRYRGKDEQCFKPPPSNQKNTKKTNHESFGGDMIHGDLTKKCFL